MFHWLDRIEIDVTSKLEITENDGWVSLNLLLVNRSNIRIWAEEATVALADLDATLQTSIATGGRFRNKIGSNPLLGGHMKVEGQDALICTNPECRTEFVVVKRVSLWGANPRCFCGSKMKHVYHSPELRLLNQSERNHAERTLHFLPSKNN